MSTYYEFYAAVEKDGRVKAIGPYVRKDGEYRLTPLLSRSRSFIQWDEFGCWDLPIEKMAEDQIEFFTDTGWISDERQSISYYIPYKAVNTIELTFDAHLPEEMLEIPGMEYELLSEEDVEREIATKEKEEKSINGKQK